MYLKFSDIIQISPQTMLNMAAPDASSSSSASVFGLHPPVPMLALAGSDEALLPPHANVSFASHPFYEPLPDPVAMRVSSLTRPQRPQLQKGENNANFQFTLSTRQASFFPQSSVR